jgi:hypothetical protein
VSEDLFLGGSQLIGCQLQLGPGKVQVIGMVDGYKVQMRMRHFQADNRKAAAIAVEGSFYSMSDRPCKQQQTGQVFIGQIKEPVYFDFGHYERMTFAKRIDIQEGIEPVIFRDLIRWYFSGNDL